MKLNTFKSGEPGGSLRCHNCGHQYYSHQRTETPGACGYGHPRTKHLSANKLPKGPACTCRAFTSPRFPQ